MIYNKLNHSLAYYQPRCELVKLRWVKNKSILTLRIRGCIKNGFFSWVRLCLRPFGPLERRALKWPFFASVWLEYFLVCLEVNVWEVAFPLCKVNCVVWDGMIWKTWWATMRLRAKAAPNREKNFHRLDHHSSICSSTIWPLLLSTQKQASHTKSPVFFDLDYEKWFSNIFFC